MKKGLIVGVYLNGRQLAERAKREQRNLSKKSAPHEDLTESLVFDETKKRIHFDHQQHNQIRWKIIGYTVLAADGVDLADAIEQRVRATVGAMK